MSATVALAGAVGNPRRHRFWALFCFLLAGAYFFIAQWIAESAARGLSSSDWFDLVARSLWLFLLLIGYWAMARVFQRQRTPWKSMGLIRRATALREFGVGAALGWGGMVVCVLPMALVGGITLTFWSGPRQFGLLLLDLATLLIGALAEEVAFRGYPFQRLIEAMGPVMATLVISALFGLLHLHNPDSTMASTLTTVLASWLLSLAYLRTRGLWLPWGWHFAWNASMGVLFGLPVSGLNFSHVILANSHGPLWLTGDGYGPEAGLIAVVVISISMGLLAWVTRDYAYEYAQPVIIPGGIPVDIDAAAARQHQDAMASPAPGETPKLVQILPVGASPSEFLSAEPLPGLDVEDEKRLDQD